MASGLSKDRTEVLWVATDFAARLRAGDSVAAIAAVSVEKASTGRPLTWSDASSEVPVTDQQISGTEVQLLLGDAPQVGQQLAGDYRVVVEVTTTQGEELTARAPLQISG